MKYTFYYTDNNSARSRGWDSDKFFRKTFNLENDREAIRKVLEIQDQAKYDEFDEATLQELKDWAFNVGADSGDPVVFYVENAHGKIIYDSDFDIDEWMSYEDEIEDLDKSRSRRLRRLHESEYTVRPETRNKLIDIIEETIEEQGNNCDLNFIDTSLITDMSRLFSNFAEFNGDISGWDVSNVKKMNRMFYGSKFTGDISKWDISSVEDMHEMFMNSKFNGDISKWNTSKVKYMSFIFKRSKFNGDISKWNTSKVVDMEAMFCGSKFTGDISRWNVSNVEDMSCMFERSDFNGDISKWDVSSVEDMHEMFMNSKFNGDISKWNVSNVKDIYFMFSGSDFNGDISKWNVSKVKDMHEMFYDSPLEGNEPDWYDGSIY